ncbi:MAG TPA: hypothetical protein DDZ51_03485 [Planctomycetaceae bacterium]|nr:hypothetical protein [Planctomycetaceae bacterium]
MVQRATSTLPAGTQADPTPSFDSITVQFLNTHGLASVKIRHSAQNNTLLGTNARTEHINPLEEGDSSIGHPKERSPRKSSRRSPSAVSPPLAKAPTRSQRLIQPTSPGIAGEGIEPKWKLPDFPRKPGFLTKAAKQ